MKNSTPTSYVYAIQVEGTNHFKIGIAQNPSKRLRQLQTGSAKKLVLAAYWEGDASLERAAHKELNAKYLRGEWFECDLEVIRTTIEAICKERKLYWQEHSAKWTKGKPIKSFDRLPLSLLQAKLAIEEGKYLEAWQLIDAIQDLLESEAA